MFRLNYYKNGAGDKEQLIIFMFISSLEALYNAVRIQTKVRRSNFVTQVKYCSGIPAFITLLQETSDKEMDGHCQRRTINMKVLTPICYLKHDDTMQSARCCQNERTSTNISVNVPSHASDQRKASVQLLAVNTRVPTICVLDSNGIRLVLKHYNLNIEFSPGLNAF